MRDWNVVVTAIEDGYRNVLKLLEPYGAIEPTEYYNVLVIRVDDTAAMLESLASLVAESPGLMNDLSRIVPAREAFDFETAEEFEEKARAVVLQWADGLAGKSFHVRLHRRGLKRELPSPREEQFLDDVILDRLEELNARGRIDFDDPDFVIYVETVGKRAGLSVWTREDRRRYRFLPTD